MINKRNVSIALTMIVLSICLMGATYRRRPEQSSSQTTVGATADVHGLVFALRRMGFDPPQLQIEQGTYLVIAQNRSGIRDLTFRVSLQGGAVLQEVHDKRLQWKKLIQLQPGTYVISVVEHPDWQSVITVTSN